MNNRVMKIIYDMQLACEGKYFDKLEEIIHLPGLQEIDESIISIEETDSVSKAFLFAGFDYYMTGEYEIAKIFMMASITTHFFDKSRLLAYPRLPAKSIPVMYEGQIYFACLDHSRKVHGNIPDVYSAIYYILNSNSTELIQQTANKFKLHAKKVIENSSSKLVIGHMSSAIDLINTIQKLRIESFNIKNPKSRLN